MKTIIIPIIAFILIVASAYAEEIQITTDSTNEEVCLYTGPYIDLINSHIWRNANQEGFLKQCAPDETNPINIGESFLVTQNGYSHILQYVGLYPPSGVGAVNIEIEGAIGNGGVVARTSAALTNNYGTLILGDTTPWTLYKIQLNPADNSIKVDLNGDGKIGIGGGDGSSLNSYQMQSCGLCGNRIKGCQDPPGIWNTIWGTCQDQGYCDPTVSLAAYLTKDTHIKAESCQSGKVELTKTFEAKECSTDTCTFDNVKETDVHVDWQCKSGFCGATASEGNIGQPCGKCGAISQDAACRESCQNEGQCYPGQIQRGTCGQCGVFEQACGSQGTATQCQWETTQACRELIVSEPGCDTPGKTRTIGNCEVQTCTIRCDLTGSDGRPILHWKTTIPGKEYPPDADTPEDNLPYDEQPYDTLIKDTYWPGEGSCAGKDSIYVREYQRLITNPECAVERVGTYAVEVERKQVVGQCGVCQNGATRATGGFHCAQVETCTNGEWQITTPARAAAAEVCGDGIDNDCDGVADPAELCNRCVPSTEICDKADNDCDGQIDEAGVCECAFGNADVNDDGTIDGRDFKSFFELNHQSVGSSESIRADFNGDGRVGNPAGGNIESGDSQCFRDIYSQAYTPVCKGTGDVNDDGNVNFDDVRLWSSQQGLCRGQAGFNPRADLDGDGCVYIMRGSPDTICMGRLHAGFYGNFRNENHDIVKIGALHTSYPENTCTGDGKGTPTGSHIATCYYDAQCSPAQQLVRRVKEIYDVDSLTWEKPYAHFFAMGEVSDASQGRCYTYSQGSTDGKELFYRNNKGQCVSLGFRYPNDAFFTGLTEVQCP